MNTWDWIALAAILAGAGIALVHLLKSKRVAAAESASPVVAAAIRAAAATRRNEPTGRTSNFGVRPIFAGTGTFFLWHT